MKKQKIIFENTVYFILYFFFFFLWFIFAHLCFCVTVYGSIVSSFCIILLLFYRFNSFHDSSNFKWKHTIVLHKPLFIPNVKSKYTAYRKPENVNFVCCNRTLFFGLFLLLTVKFIWNIFSSDDISILDCLLI